MLRAPLSAAGSASWRHWIRWRVVVARGTCDAVYLDHVLAELGDHGGIVGERIRGERGEHPVALLLRLHAARPAGERGLSHDVAVVEHGAVPDAAQLVAADGDAAERLRRHVRHVV